MDDPTNMEDLAEIGLLAARVQIAPDHFPEIFDLRTRSKSPACDW